MLKRVSSDGVCPLQKGHGYHLDLFVLSFLILICSLMGLPWFVAATVRSITHVKSLMKESEVKIPGEKPQMIGCRLVDGHVRKLQTIVRRQVTETKTVSPSFCSVIWYFEVTIKSHRYEISNRNVRTKWWNIASIRMKLFLKRGPVTAVDTKPINLVWCFRHN